MTSEPLWDMTTPFVKDITVSPAMTDRLGHANNVQYLQWMESISWDHLGALSLPWELQYSLQRAMVIRRTEIDYLLAAYEGDVLRLGTWLIETDGKLRSARQFQLIRLADQRTLMRATCQHVCINLRNGKPARMPAEFVQAFAQASLA